MSCNIFWHDTKPWTSWPVSWYEDMQIRPRTGHLLLSISFISLNILLIFKGQELSNYRKVAGWIVVRSNQMCHVSIFRVKISVLYLRARRRRYRRWRGGAGQRTRSTSPSQAWSGLTSLYLAMMLTSKENIETDIYILDFSQFALFLVKYRDVLWRYPEDRIQEKVQ